MSEPSITFSERATRRIAEILKAEAAPALFRVSVEGGGCSGFQYRFDLVTETTQTICWSSAMAPGWWSIQSRSAFYNGPNSISSTI